jgi:PAS domain S-box-containing protein
MAFLPELIDLDVLRGLTASLWRSYGLPIKIVDVEGRVLASSGQQDICTVFHQRHAVTLQRCIETDTDLTGLRQAAESGMALETHCRNGLVHIGLPIIVAGRHLATLFLSQFFYAPPDEEAFRQRARALDLDEEQYLAALRQVPVLDRARVREVIVFFEMLVGLLAEMGKQETILLDSRAQLRQSEEKFRSIFKCANDALFILDPAGRIREVNDMAGARLGYAAAEFEGMHFKDLELPESAALAEERLASLVARGEGVFEAVQVAKDGRLLPVEISARQLTIGDSPAILAIARDLTERKRQERELIYRERFEALLAGISTRFMELGPAGFDQAVTLALEEMGEFAGVDRTYLFLFSEGGERMSNSHEWCAEGISCERWHLQEVAVKELPWIMAKLLNREVVHVRRVADLPPEAEEEKEHFAAQNIRSLLTLPVLSEGVVAGFVGFDAVRAEKAWDERDLVLLRTIGEIIGSALDRRKAAETLDYRARLEHLIAQLSTHMINLDPEAIDAAIDTVLRDLGLFVGVDRCYLFQLSPGERMSNTHEWCAPGIVSFREELQSLDLTALPWFQARIRRAEAVYIPDVAALGPEADHEKAVWSRESIRSLLCIPVLLEEKLLGFIGLDAVRQAKRWPPEIILLLRVVGECLANALERRRRDRELRLALIEAEEGRTNIAAILRSLGAGLLATDGEGRIMLMNQVAHDMLGLTVAPVSGRRLAELPVEAGLKGQVAAVLAERASAEAVEWEMPAPDGGVKRVIQAYTDPVTSKDGRGMGAISLLRDVSLEREVDRMKSEFISTAAHELRTPLTSVIGYAELLLEQIDAGTFSPDSREFLEEILEKGEALAEIVNDLLDLSRVESGQLVCLHLLSQGMDQLLRNVTEDFRRLHPDYRFELRLPETMVQVLLDPGKIRQVLENLLGNAVKFSPKGSVVRVTSDCTDQELITRVQDEGIGMTPEQLRHIFDKFYRGDASNTAVGGLGLGMAIARNIIEAHGGRIAVESAPGRGTTVTFTLPLEARDREGDL